MVQTWTMHSLRLLLSLAWLFGFAAPSSAQQNARCTPSGLRAHIVIEKTRYTPGERIKLALTVENSSTPRIITTKEFSVLPYYLFMRFIAPDGKGIVAKALTTIVSDEPPPPRALVVGEEILQVEEIEALAGRQHSQPFARTVTLPDVRAFYPLALNGHYTVQARIPVRTYPDREGVVRTVAGVAFATLGAAHPNTCVIESNVVNFSIRARVTTGDLDGDQDVDSADIDMLLLDRDKTTRESVCGTACDLDGDGRITMLDARRLVALCTRPGCATS